MMLWDVKSQNRGMAVHPVVYAYDQAVRLVSMKSFHADARTTTGNPMTRQVGDETLWCYYEATGLLLSKTYPDLHQKLYGYYTMNRLTSKTQARQVDDRETSLTTTYVYDELSAHLLQVCHNDKMRIVYYNYLYNNTQDGRWINRDPIAEQGGVNLYAYVGNRVSFAWDELGLKVYWPSRDLESFFLGNHHYIVMTFDKKEQASKGSSPIEIRCKNSCKTIWVVSLALTVKKDIQGQYDVIAENHHVDIEVFKEKYCDETHWFKRDWDYESFLIKPPRGKKQEEFEQDVFDTFEKSQDYLQKYRREYELTKANCASWGNDLLTVVRIDAETRKDAGNKDGIDWVEDKSFF